jgi:hypothetical protein
MSTNANSSDHLPPIRANLGRNENFIRSAGRYARQQIRDTQYGKSTARTNALRTNASLPENSWEAVDNAVYRTQQETLRLVQDLRAAGLTYNLGDLMAEVDTWHILDESGSADIDMDPETATAESSVSYGMDGTPVPIIHDDFSIGFREGPAEGEGVGESLDTLGATVASRHVAEAIESMFVDASSLQITSGSDAFQLYGMTDHPATATGTTTADWTADNTVVRDDIRAMRSVLKNDRNYNPSPGYWLYLGTEYYDVLDDADPEGDGNQTIRDRVENLSGIAQIREMQYLPNKSALLFRPTSDVIEVGMANDVQTVQWESPFRDNFKIMAAFYPRIKKTADDETGILYWTA